MDCVDGSISGVQNGEVDAEENVLFRWGLIMLCGCKRCIYELASGGVHTEVSVVDG